MNKKAYSAETIYSGQETLSNQAILTENNIVTGFSDIEKLLPGYELLEFPGCFITPSFIDLQIYGGNGMLFSHSLDESSISSTYDYCVSGGCSHFMITMATNSLRNFRKGVDAARAYLKSGKKGLLGLHLEGPWINPSKRGAHILKFIHKPEIQEVVDLIEYGKNVIQMITLAPEQCEPSIIKYLLQNNILISAGHSNASYSAAKKGFESGISAATHLFNAMSPLQGREPGMVGAIYDDSQTVASIICDGVHVDFASVRISQKMLGERLYFITDAVTEIEKGDYQHVFQGNRYTLPDGTLSGSCMTMISTLRNAVREVGIPLESAVRMCTVTPAILSNRPDLGKISIGCSLNINVIDSKNLTVVKSFFN